MVGISSSSKPIFLVTHPRAISTAFERAFLTRDNDIACVHEPFSDAYHWGPEKLSERYENVEKLRAENGFQDYTYHVALGLVNGSKQNGKRVFVKDMAKCLMPLPGGDPRIAPSLQYEQRTINRMDSLQNHTAIPNPTVIPPDILSGFHYTFLIRNPRQSIPSLYQCSIPPKSHITGWNGFKATDAGYAELRILFDYLVQVQIIGPGTGNDICIVDADDLLADPEGVVEEYCCSVGIPYDPQSLHWGAEKDQQRARDIFQNWIPFHDAALKSTSLKPRPPRVTTLEDDIAEWTEKFGAEAAMLIHQNVEDNMEDYLYLKQFAIKT
ncbi:P-loop containing nucleoside triphosphate hydrolase protein [Aspergillus sergii]|uniref:P-loop containing nucleoside triphosphate hydrolase protein n=1 Tax=Aspergillus sergii TaxID=1034303 RepID=A0A5N6WTE9_9EURO|nr:P-loop containing nucleoside triphosphate hydrolase protein [Aspergillus sergii]